MILVRRSQQHSLVINDSGLLPFKLIEMCMTCKSLATFLCLSLSSGSTLLNVIEFRVLIFPIISFYVSFLYKLHGG